MKTSEYNKTEEFYRSAETTEYSERTLTEEFLNYKVKRIEEFNGAEGSASAKRPRKNKSHKSLFVSALAAVGSAAIITVAVVTALLGITVRFKTAGYDYIDYGLTVSNGGGKTLFGRLSNSGEIIQVTELGSDEVSVRFEELQLNMPYLFEVVDEEGKVYFKDEIRTRSPLNFYNRGDSPDALFFSADLEAFKGSGVYYPFLRGANGENYELPVQTGWEAETSINLNDLLPGEYTLVIVDSGGEYSYEIYNESVYIDGLLAARLRYEEVDGRFNKIFIELNPKTVEQYDRIIVALANSDLVSTPITDNVIDLSVLSPGEYTVTISGIKNSSESEILRESIFVPAA